MSKDYPNIYNPITKNVYSILDSLEHKLSRYKGYTNNGVQSNFNYYNNNYNKKEKDDNNKNNDIDYNLIKKMIRNEFSQLILPYHQDFNFNFTSLESKINSLNSKIDFMKDK